MKPPKKRTTGFDGTADISISLQALATSSQPEANFRKHCEPLVIPALAIFNALI
jgi:hypothetical protein